MSLAMVLKVEDVFGQAMCKEYAETCDVVRQSVQRQDSQKFADNLRQALARIGGGNPIVKDELFKKQWDFIASQARAEGLNNVEVIAIARAQLGSTPRNLRIIMFGVSGGRIYKSNLWNEFLIAAPNGSEPKPKLSRCNCKKEVCFDLVKSSDYNGTIVKQMGSLILELDSPTCFRGTGRNEDAADSIDYPGQVALHLAPSQSQFSEMLKLVGSHVSLNGKAFGAFTAHHLTPVVLSSGFVKAK